MRQWEVWLSDDRQSLYICHYVPVAGNNCFYKLSLDKLQLYSVQEPEYSPKNLRCYGVLGSFELWDNENRLVYIILITDIQKSCSLGNSTESQIYQIRETVFVPLEAGKCAQVLDQSIQDQSRSLQGDSGSSTPLSDLSEAVADDPREIAPPTSGQSQSNQDSLLGSPESKQVIDRVYLRKELNSTFKSIRRTSGLLSTNDKPPQYLACHSGRALFQKFIQVSNDLFSSGCFYCSPGNGMATPLDWLSDTLELYDGDPSFVYNDRLRTQFGQNFGPCEALVRVIQGFAGERIASLPNDTSCKIVLISTRSSKRNGVRYQRRGANNAGYVANFVESNQYLVTEKSSTKLIDKFCQIRGSIPLLWSQSPWSLHPVPALYGAESDQEETIRKHLSLLRRSYGPLLLISLVNKHGREESIGRLYEREARVFGSKFIWWDFHRETAGMQYGNTSRLIDEIRPDLDRIGWNGNNVAQDGVIRTNCMDCLDRTNVVQSAIGEEIIKRQLVSHDFCRPLHDGWSDYKELFDLLRDLWADNGDSVSMSYAGSAALKGDFTRTGRRSSRGIFMDAGNSIRRYFQNAVADFFLQTCIDFLLGVSGQEAFTNFEANMLNQDPSVTFTLERARRHAAEVSASIVVHDDEDIINICNVLAVHGTDLNSHAKQIAENVFILTNVAIYYCTFDYNDDKVTAFTRIGLEHIEMIQHGAFITNTVHTRFLDTSLNYGFVVQYRNQDAETRHRSRTVQTKSNDEAISDDTLLAKFKLEPSLLPANAIDPRSFVLSLVEDIQRCYSSKHQQGLSIVCEDIVGVQEARESSNLLDHLSHKFKQWIWARS